MNKGVCLNQRHRIILRLVGWVLAITACCTILVATPNGEKISVTAASTARNTAVAHMRLMGTTKWIPQNSTWYIHTRTYTDNTKTKYKIDDYIKGKTYKGMPYTQSQSGLKVWSDMSAKLTSVYYPIADVYYCNLDSTSEHKKSLLSQET
jgi:hypothetical protein